MVGILVSDRSHRVQRRTESCCHCAMSPKPCCRELVSQALQRFCEGKVGLSYLPPGSPWDNGYIESFNNRLRKECLNRKPLEQSVRSPGGYRRLQIRAQPPPPAFGPGLPNAGRVRCGVQAHPHPGACEMNRIRTKDTDSKTGCDVFPVNEAVHYSVLSA